MRFNDVGVLVEIAIVLFSTMCSAVVVILISCWWIVTAKKAAKDAKQNPADKDGTVTEPDDCA